MRILAAEPDPSLFFHNSGEDRAAGVHLSDILSRMAWDRDKKYHPDAPKDLSMFECGFIWETALDRALAARHGARAGYRPDQLEEDGIWMSPDWVNPDADVQCEEWKATRKSINKAAEKVEEWAPQAKSYLRALLKRGLATAPIVRWRVWFMMGDWTFENKGDLTLLKDYYRIDVEFTKRELEENWRGIVAAGHKYGLLKAPPEERAWRRPRLEATVAKREAAKRKHGGAPPPLREKARLVTFPPTRKLLKRRSAS